MTRKIYFFATLVMLVSIQTFSADLLYPELHVVPSAEDRLRQASKNDDGFFMRNWQLLTPSVALIASGGCYRVIKTLIQLILILRQLMKTKKALSIMRRCYKSWLEPVLLD